MRKRKLLTLLSGICLVLVLAALPFTAACAKPAPAPPPTPTPTLVKPIKLKFAHPLPPMETNHKAVFVPWVEKIKERTTAIGKPVEITIYPAESLVKEPDLYKAVVQGIAELAMWHTGTMPGKLPLSEVMDFSFLFPSATVGGQVWQELYDTHPEFRDEYAEAKVMWFMPAPPQHLQARTKQVKTLEDLKGMKVWADGDPAAEALKALGAVPVFMAIPEVYIALERGVLDAAFLCWNGTFSFKWFEVTKYRTAFPRGFSMGTLVVSMNWNTWNSLPPDVQKIFEDLSGPYMSRLCGETIDGANMGLLGMIKEYDQKVGNPEIYNLPQDEFQRWVKAVTPVYDKWMAEREAKGLPGRAIFEDAQRLIEKYSK